MREATYDVHALRYASRTCRRTEVFLRPETSGSPTDEILELDYYFWLVRNDARTVLVDCGFDRERAAAKNRFQDTDPVELLGRMDVRPEDVDHVVLTHMHYDHVGNVERFPHATFSIAREEYDFWCGPSGDRELMPALVDPEEVRMVRQLAHEERLHLVDGAEELFPGLSVTRLGGHTPGQLIVQVDSGDGEVVLASDAAHYYEEIEHDRPFTLFTSLPDMYRAYDILRDLAARPRTTVIAGHDPRVRSLFPQVRPDCLDLTTPLPPQDESSPVRRSHASTSARAPETSSPRTARPSPIVDPGQSRV
jgi:glyoxylase-like metal-dependent hydrolase (beta-lactamase superfamily II)